VQDVAVRITEDGRGVSRSHARLFRSIRRKLPFVLFKNREDYYDVGGPRGQAPGVFNGKMLLRWRGSSFDNRSWYIIQHEGFHTVRRRVSLAEISRRG
jgi:hypothetical protein